MNTITVTASRTYDVHIGAGLLTAVDKYLGVFVKPCKVAIISDSNVWPLYGATLTDSLTAVGYEVIHYVFPAGEESKNGSVYLSILEFLADNKLIRSDMLIALGGGVVGDLTGFVAATYLRGIRFVQIPTTLLAMVDSSVGGKTAIDLIAGKNLVGAFYQPVLVLCDLDTLSTLPAAVFRDGCAEVIKYGTLYDPILFSHLEERQLKFDREYVITRCVELKRDVVAEDEYDTGARQKLNLGHTIGHGVEALSSYTISHGEAVSIGMGIVARFSGQYSICNEETALRIQRILTAFHLPIRTDFTAQQLYNAALSDKKRIQGAVNLILPQEIGSCNIVSTPLVQLKAYIEAGL